MTKCRIYASNVVLSETMHTIIILVKPWYQNMNIYQIRFQFELCLKCFVCLHYVSVDFGSKICQEINHEKKEQQMNEELGASPVLIWVELKRIWTELRMIWEELRQIGGAMS